MGRLSPVDLAGAAVTFAVGLVFVLHGLDYPLGTMQRMGAGAFPVFLGAVAIVLSALMLLRAVAVANERLEPPHWRAFLAVIGSIGAFGLALPTLGLGPAILGAVAAASFGRREARPWQTALLALGLAAAAWLLFIRLLALPMPFLAGVA